MSRTIGEIQVSGRSYQEVMDVIFQWVNANSIKVVDNQQNFIKGRIGLPGGIGLTAPKYFEVSMRQIMGGFLVHSEGYIGVYGFSELGFDAHSFVGGIPRKQGWKVIEDLWNRLRTMSTTFLPAAPIGVPYPNMAGFLSGGFVRPPSSYYASMICILIGIILLLILLPFILMTLYYLYGGAISIDILYFVILITAIIGLIQLRSRKIIGMHLGIIATIILFVLGIFVALDSGYIIGMLLIFFIIDGPCIVTLYFLTRPDLKMFLEQEERQAQGQSGISGNAPSQPGPPSYIPMPQVAQAPSVFIPPMIPPDRPPMPIPPAPPVASAPDMKFCIICGNQLPRFASFCSKCGGKQ